MANPDEAKIVRLVGAPTRFSEREAVDALRRAAGLQQEAATALEQRSSNARTLGDLEGRTYDTNDLLAAAQEAGIQPEFARVALVAASRGPAAAIDASHEQTASRWLGTDRRIVVASRLIDSPADRVWETLLALAESSDFRLRLEGVTGGSPIDGGVASFRMDRLMALMSRTGTYTALAFAMEQVEAWELHAWLRPAGQRTELNFYVDLRAGTVRNTKWARRSSFGLGVLAAGGAFAGVLALGPVLAGAAALASVVGGTGLGRLGWRAIYRRAVRKLHGELERLLSDVDHQVRLGAYRAIGRRPGTDDA